MRRTDSYLREPKYCDECEAALMTLVRGPPSDAILINDRVTDGGS